MRVAGGVDRIAVVESRALACSNGECARSLVIGFSRDGTPALVMPEVRRAPRHPQPLAFVRPVHAEGALLRFRARRPRGRAQVRGAARIAGRRPGAPAENPPRRCRPRPFRRPIPAQRPPHCQLRPPPLAREPSNCQNGRLRPSLARALRSHHVSRRSGRRAARLAAGIARRRWHAERSGGAARQSREESPATIGPVGYRALIRGDKPTIGVIRHHPVLLHHGSERTACSHVSAIRS